MPFSLKSCVPAARQIRPSGCAGLFERYVAGVLSREELLRVAGSIERLE